MRMRELQTCPAAQVKQGDIMVMGRHAAEVVRVRRCEDSRFLRIEADDDTSDVYHERTMVRIAR